MKMQLFKRMLVKEQDREKIEVFVRDPSYKVNKTVEDNAGMFSVFFYLVVTLVLTILLKEKLFDSTDSVILIAIAIANTLFCVIHGIYLYDKYLKKDKACALRMYAHKQIVNIITAYSYTNMLILADDSLKEATGHLLPLFGMTLIDNIFKEIMVVIFMSVVSVCIINSLIKRGKRVLTTPLNITVVILTLFWILLILNGTFKVALVFMIVSAFCCSVFLFWVFELKIIYAKSYRMKKLLPQMTPGDDIDLGLLLKMQAKIETKEEVKKIEKRDGNK